MAVPLLCFFVSNRSGAFLIGIVELLAGVLHGVFSFAMPDRAVGVFIAPILILIGALLLLGGVATKKTALMAAWLLISVLTLVSFAVSLGYVAWQSRTRVGAGVVVLYALRFVVKCYFVAVGEMARREMSGSVSGGGGGHSEKDYRMPSSHGGDTPEAGGKRRETDL